MNQPENTSLPPQSENVTWKVLIVDDEDDVHQITRFFLNDFSYAGRKLSLLSAYSSTEAQRLLREHPDIAVALLDVVMETTDAGLRLVEFMREGLHNRFIRIILRTAEQDYAPEEDVVRRYEIDGYATKMELNARKLFTLLTAALRAYAHIMELEAQRNLLEEKVAERTRELHDKNEELSDVNKALISLDREKDELMSVLAHDIKNALFAIRGLSEEIYQTKPPPSDDIQRYAEMIYATAQKSFGVIVNFLDLDALETGRLHVRLHAVDILPELHIIATQYTENAKNKNIKIRFEHNEPSYEAYVDENLVQQVLDNLVSNALKYSPPQHQYHYPPERQRPVGAL